jgi:Flp pilus assembly protein TadG
MALLVGILEVGRMVFIYAAVTNASREASRYGSAVGLNDSGTTPKYQDCDGIRAIAKRSAYFMNLSDADITISYDHGPSAGSPFDECPVGMIADPSIQVNTLADPDRVVVTVMSTYSPMVTLVPISSRTITSSSARTILGILDMNTGNSVVPTTGSTNTAAPTVPATAAPSNTPTLIPTGPSDTPTATQPGGELITFTPLPSSTPTDTPTITPTFTPTFTPTMTFTPTSTSTPVPGCGNITTGSISITGGNNLMSLTITNPHESVTILNIQVIWNSASGGPAGKPLALKSANLEGIFWTGTDSSGNFTITPSTTVTIPGNNVTTPIIFAFDKNYQNKSNTESITINLSTPGCESFPIHSP